MIDEDTVKFSVRNERVYVLGQLENTRHGIQYWTELRDSYKKEIEDLVVQFNRTIEKYKNAKRQISLGQERLRKLNEKYDILQKFEDMMF